MCGSASPVLTATGFVNVKRAIFDPLRNRHLSTEHKSICHRWLCRRSLQLCHIRCTSVQGGFWANGWNITIFYLYLDYMKTVWPIGTKFGTVTHIGHPNRSVRPVDRFSRVMAETTRNRAWIWSRDCFKILRWRSPTYWIFEISNF